ncbi:hypothetical protein Cgig2_007174 [Carnegiea gigantea]|uniref:Pentatricopeptide repeat-containing protein n=1 Tax=Carnegiea gigantea TaxID=171969 RepID=A0A9Q1JLY1_9CARY|nr:hypothetical protein Cgig2_007174 [Carnegiea gigantea]
MAHFAGSKLPHLRPRCITLSLHQRFCSTTSTDDPSLQSLSSVDQIPKASDKPVKMESPNDLQGETEQKRRILKGKHRNPEKIEDILCRMMANRAWTSRLQNSIRNLVPQFDQSLVYNVLDRARSSEHALQFFRCVEKSGLFRHDRGTRMKIIERLGRASELNHARCILMDMPNKGVPWDDMFVVLIDSYGEKGIVQESVKIFQQMKELGVERTEKSYDAFFKIEATEKFFVEMKGRNIAPTVISYTTMIKGYVSMGKVDDALRMVEEMKSFGIKPNAVTYTTLLPGDFEAMKMSEAQMILQEMVERHTAPKDNSIFIKLLTCQCKSEAGHYGVLIENFCKAKAYDRAVKLLDNLVEKEIILRPQSTFDVESDAYKAIIEYLCNHCQTEKAETLFRQLMKKGVQDPIAFNNLIRGHSKERNPEAAFEMLKIMIRRGVPSEADAYKLLIHSFLEKGEPADAKVVLDSMIENGHLLTQLCSGKSWRGVSKMKGCKLQAV